LGPIPNPQSPIPNPQSPIPKNYISKKLINFKNNVEKNNKKNNKKKIYIKNGKRNRS